MYSVSLKRKTITCSFTSVACSSFSSMGFKLFMILTPCIPIIRSISYREIEAIELELVHLRIYRRFLSELFYCGRGDTQPLLLEKHYIYSER